MSQPRITDICLVTRDLETAVEFYTDKLGYELDSKMPGFADFVGPGCVLAVWDANLIRQTTGVPAALDTPPGHGVMVACELESPAAVDQMYQRLSAKDVECYGPPSDYAWNARCLYFAGPCGEFWEFFAWHGGGKPGRATPTETDNPKDT